MRESSPLRFAQPILVLALVLGTLAAATSPLHAQRLERHILSGDDVAVYNIAGAVVLEPGMESHVVVQVERGGRDADRLDVSVARLGGRPTLVVHYPETDIVYDRLGGRSRTTVRVRNDGTFYGGIRGVTGARSYTIRGSGHGLEAHADLRIEVPVGHTIAVHVAAGEARVANVEGKIVLDLGAASATARGTRGALRIDTSSGRTSVHDAEGEVVIDTGSGRVEVEGVRGPRLHIDTGSGAVSGRDIEADEVEVDTGSGRIQLAGVRARDISLDTGSGAIGLGLLTDIDRLNVRTGSGSVTLAVPATLNADLRASTGSGRITVDLPMQSVERRRSNLSGRIGEGGGTIRIVTGSGRITVRSETPVALSPAAPRATR